MNKFVTVVTCTLLTVVVVGVALYSAYRWHPPTTRFFDGVYVAAQLPNDIKNVTFVSFGENGVNTYYKPSLLGLEVVTYPQFPNLTSFNPSKNLQTFSKSLVDSVSETLPSSIGNTKPVDPNESRVYVQSNGADPILVARGHAPIFIDDEQILFFGPTGIVIYNTESKMSSIAFPYSSTTKLSQVQYSANKSSLFWKREGDNELVLARITPDGVTVMRTFSNLTSPILRSDAVYDVRFTDRGSELWRTTFDGSSAQVVTFPVSLNIRKIISN